MTEGLNVTISTTDTHFMSDLNREGIDGIVATYGPTLAVEDADPIYRILISAATTSALGKLSAWLYERVQYGKSSKMTLNNNNIVRNPDRITVIINTQILQYQSANKDPKAPGSEMGRSTGLGAPTQAR